MPPSAAELRARALLNAQWDMEDDQDLTMENEEKFSEARKEKDKEVRRQRRDTIMMASQSSAAYNDCDDDENENAHNNNDGNNNNHGGGPSAIFPDGYQEIPLVGGGMYKGFIKRGAFDGIGELSFSNGDVYEGNFQRDLRHGYGKFVAKKTSSAAADKQNKIFTVTRYEGSWVEDRREGGWGVATYSNGDSYEGPFHANRPDTSLWWSSSSSSSSCSNNKAGGGAVPLSAVSDDELVFYLKNGKLPDGHAYSADVSAATAKGGGGGGNDLASSSSTTAASAVFLASSAGKLPTYRFADGRVYVGEFKSASRDGRGALRVKNNDTTVGHFVGGIPHGQATIRYGAAANTNTSSSSSSASSNAPGKPKKFSGTFKYGKRFEGRLTYTDGKIYEGYWHPATEKPHGRGTCRMRCGDVYYGEWFGGKMSGRGRIVYTPDGPNAGRIYDGEWVGDRPHGRGSMLLPSGVLLTCLWDGGKQVAAAEHAAKVKEWEVEEAKRYKESLSSLAAGGQQPALRVLSPSQLAAAVQRWSLPVERRPNSTADDLPSLDWFTNPPPSLGGTENGGGESTKAVAKKKKAVVVIAAPPPPPPPPSAAAVQKKSGGADAAEVSDSDIDLDDDDDDDDFDLDAIESALKDKRPKEAEDDTAALDKMLDGDEDGDADGDDDEDAWEHFAEVSQPTETSGPSDEEHSKFLRELRRRGFAADLLGSVDDYADSDEDEKEAEEARKREVAERAKDTAWFTNEDYHHPSTQQLAFAKPSPNPAPKRGGGGASPASPLMSSSSSNNTANAKNNTTNTSAATPSSSSSGPAAAVADFDDSDMQHNNDTIAGAETVAKGWLDKYSIGKSFLGQLIGAGGWKRRYFTLLLLTKKGGNNCTGALSYYEDEACSRHLGTVSLSSRAASTTTAAPTFTSNSSILYTNPDKLIHKKAERPELDIVIDYAEDATQRYKLLLRASDSKEHDKWVMYLSKVVKQRR